MRLQKPIPLLSRFRILELLSVSGGSGISCTQLAKSTGIKGYWTAAFCWGLAGRLHRLIRWGLVSRGTRFGKPVYSLTDRGRSRLIWARGKGLL